MSEENKKLVIWNQVNTTDRKFTKDVSFGGRNYTSIQAQYQRLKATKLFGPYGMGWGVRNCVWGYNHSELNDKGVIVKKVSEITLEAEFYYTYDGKEYSFEISVDGRYSPGQDCRKKALTDLTTKALSFLGFSADIFMDGKKDDSFQDNKYANPTSSAQTRRSVRPNRAKAQINKKLMGQLIARLESQDDKAKMKTLEHAAMTYDFTEEQKNILEEIENAIAI